MSKERCQAVKGLMKQTLGIMQSGSCGEGRGLSLAVTYLEDAYLRLDYHMRENGYLDQPQTSAESTRPSFPAGGVEKATRASNLVPAAPIPQLGTGLMNPPAVAPVPKAPTNREKSEVLDDISLLG